MPTQLQFRRGNTAQTSVFTGVVAELTVDTTKKTIVVHDGVTPGGNPLATMTFAQASYDAANSAGSSTNVVAAFDKANSANVLAQAAYDSGNTTLTYAQAGFGKANAANSLAQGAFDKANNSTDLWVRDQANAAFDKANTAYTAGSDAYNFATTGNNTANAAFLKANSANVLAQASFDSGNTTLTYAQAGFGKANAANVLAQASFDVANTKFNSAGGAITGNVTLTGNIIPSVANTYFLGSPDVPFHSLFVGSGSVNIGGVVLSNTNGSLGVTSSTGNTLDFTFISNTANAGFDKANSANVLAQAAFDSGNTTLTYAQAGFGKANAANVLAQDAYDRANTKFNSSGGTISGDTTVTGNLTVTGTTFYANVTNVVVEDNIITLNSNVTGTPGIDAGLEVNRGNQTNTSILWSEADKSWEFTNDGTTYNKIASGAFANSAYNKANSANVLAQAAFDSGNTTLTYAQSGFAKANAGFDKANSANVLAQAAFDAGNTVSSYSSSGYDKANSANVLAQAAFDSGNTTLTYAQSGYGKANSANVLAQAAYGQANTGTTLAQASYDSGNTTLTYAQAGFGKANAANVLAQAAYGQANTNASDITTIQGVDLTQNTNITAADTKAQAAYNKANTGGTLTGVTHITDTTQSTTDTNGALYVDGGVGVAKNLNVGGDAIITGTLTVVGGTTSTSSTTITYANPYISLHDPAGNTYISTNDGVDIGIQYEYFDDVGAQTVVTGGSGNGTTATLTISDRFISPVGEVIQISGVVPSGFNGSWIVTASSAGSVSFLNSTNASVVTSGALGNAKRITHVPLNSGTYSAQVANVAFTDGATGCTIPTGKWITITGCTPNAYNGTYQVLSSGPGYVRYTIGNPNPGSITVAGTMILANRHAFSGWANDSGYFEFYKAGDFDATGSFGGLYGGIKAGKLIASAPQSISATDLTAGGFLQVPTTKIYDVTSAPNATVAQVASVASLGVVTVDAANTGITYTNGATLYIAGAPVAGNNTTFAGNTYSLEVASGKTWFGGDVEFHTANGITFYDSSKQSTAAAPYAYSNASFSKANSANVLAQAAYGQANTGTTIAQAAYDSGNTTLTYAQAGFGKANAANVLAQASYDSGNTTLTYAQAGFGKANAANVLAQAAFDAGNTTNTYATSAYGKANSANVLAQAAFDSGNTTLTYAQAGFANANAAYSQANATQTYATSGYGKANSANVLAQAAFDAANTKFASAGGTISGDTNITGNLTVSGTTFYANTVSLLVKDNIITLNSNVTGTPTQDSGIEVNRGSSTNTSILWSETDKSWEFTNDGTTYNKIASGAFANAAYNMANSANVLAQAAFGKANGAVQTGFTTISANGTSITPSSNADTFTITSATANGINVLNPSSKTIDIGLRNSGVTGGTYGGSTNIPVITFDAFGRATSASNVAVSTTINTSGTSGTGSVAGGGTLTFTGNTGISTYATGSTIYINNTGVQSFNGMTGAVTLSSANVTSALGFTPANKAGDNFTGAVIVPTLTANTSVSLNGIGYDTSNTFTTSSTSQVSVDAFATTTYRSARYFVQMTSGSSYHIIELFMVHDGTTVSMAQYGEVFTGSSLGTFDASITTGTVNLLFTPTNSATTVKLIKRSIVV